MDWLDSYLDNLSDGRNVIYPPDKHTWTPARPNKQQQSMIQDSMAFDVQQMRLIQEARQELEKHGASTGVGADPGSPANQQSSTPTPTPTPTPTVTPTPSPTVTPTVTPVPYPDNAAGPITMVSTKTSGNNWFGVRTSTGYAKTTWWDGSSQVDGNGSPTSEFIPLKTTAPGTKTIYLSSCNSSGAKSGNLTHINFGYDLSYSSLCAYGCSSLIQLAGVAFQANLSAVDVRGCTALGSIQVYNNSKVTSILLDGTPNLATVTMSNNPLLSGSFDFSNKPVESLYINNCSISAINLQGCSSLYSANLNGNKFKSLDLSNLRRLNGFNASECPSLSSVNLLGSTGVDLATITLNNCNLSALNMSALTALGGFNVNYNKISSGITLSPSWGGRASYNSTVIISNNNMTATDLNNFFTALGTYIGSYDYYGTGAQIYYGGNPGSNTCDPGIASAKGWQPVNA